MDGISLNFSLSKRILSRQFFFNAPSVNKVGSGFKLRGNELLPAVKRTPEKLPGEYLEEECKLAEKFGFPHGKAERIKVFPQ